MNTSTVTDEHTARTCLVCAKQRAEYLGILGVTNVLELCVGPSLRTLEQCYGEYKITTTGNDVDARWKAYYPEGDWRIGDARKLDTRGFDAVVVAPPLSSGCSGRRIDSLFPDQVYPSYDDFLRLPNPVVVYVLPAKTLSLKEGRKQLHKLLAKIDRKYEVVPLKSKRVTKYVDIYTF